MEDDEFDWGEADDAEELVDYDYDDWDNLQTETVDSELPRDLDSTAAPSVKPENVSLPLAGQATQAENVVSSSAEAVRGYIPSDPAEKPVPDDGPGMEEASKARKVVKDEPSAVPSGSIEKKQPASEKAAQQVSTRDRIAPEKPTKSGRMRIPIPKPVPAPSDNEVKGKVVSAPFIDSKSDGNKQEPTKADGPSSASNGHGVKRERDSSTQWVNGQRYSHQRTSMNGGVSRARGVPDVKKILPQQSNLPLPPGYKPPVPPPRPPPGPPPRPQGGVSVAGAFGGVPLSHRHHGPGTPINQGPFPGTGSQLIPGMGLGVQPLVGFMNGNAPAFLQGMGDYRGNQPADFLNRQGALDELVRPHQPSLLPHQQQAGGLSHPYGGMSLPMPGSAGALLSNARPAHQQAGLPQASQRPPRQGGPQGDMRPPFNVNSRGGATWDPERRRQEVGPGLVPNSGRSGGLSLGMQTDLAGANSGQVGGRQMRDGPPMPGGGDMIMVRGQESAVGQSSTMWAGRPGFNNNSRPPNAPSSGLRLPTGPPPVLAGDMGYGLDDDTPVSVLQRPQSLGSGPKPQPPLSMSREMVGEVPLDRHLLGNAGQAVGQRRPVIPGDPTGKLHPVPQVAAKKSEASLMSPSSLKLEEIRKQRKMLEIQLQRQENIVKAREREQKLKEMREAYEAKKARLTAWAAPQTATPDATLQEMKDQIFKLSQIVSKMSEGAQTTAPAPTAAVSDAPQPKAVSQATAGDGLQPGTSDGTPRDATSRVHRNEEMSTIVTSFQPPKQLSPVVAGQTKDKDKEKKRKEKDKKRKASPDKNGEDLAPTDRGKVVEWEAKDDLRKLLTRKRMEEGRADGDVEIKSESRLRSSRTRPNFNEVYRPKGAR